MLFALVSTSNSKWGFKMHRLTPCTPLFRLNVRRATCTKLVGGRKFYYPNYERAWFVDWEMERVRLKFRPATYICARLIAEDVSFVQGTRSVCPVELCSKWSWQKTGVSSVFRFGGWAVFYNAENLMSVFVRCFVTAGLHCLLICWMLHVSTNEKQTTVF